MDSRALAVTGFWAKVLPDPPRADWLYRISALAAEASLRRSKADFNTGSIAWLEAYQLCALANYLPASVVLEVGTFIGTSTTALSLGEHVEAIYTCDSSNDCCPCTDVIRTHPFTTSRDMFLALLKRGVLADLCFFDGHLSGEDVEALKALTHRNTVFAIHDYNYGPKIRKRQDGTRYTDTVPRKGIGAVALLAPWLKDHALVEPLEGTTMAALVPKALL